MSRSKNEAPPFRLEAKRADLLQAVTRAATTIERRHTVPILSCVRLEMGFGTLAVTGTNLDTEVRSEIEAQGEGATCLPAYRLRDLLRSLPADTVRFEGDLNGIVTLSAGATEASSCSLPVQDHPTLSVEHQLWKLQLAEGVFSYLVGGAAEVMSTDDTRYYLNGVCLEVRDGAAIATATDGHRLVSRSSNLAGQVKDRSPIIMPRQAVQVALPLVGASEVTLVAFGADSNGSPSKLEISGGGARLRLKLIDGTFPDWRRVVPPSGGAVIALNVGELAMSLRLAKANASDRGRAVVLSDCDGGVRLTSDNPDFGKVTTRLAAEGELACGRIGINAEYLAGMARAAARIGSKSLRLQITDPGSPIRIEPDAALGGSLSVLMPMRV